MVSFKIQRNLKPVEYGIGGECILRKRLEDYGKVNYNHLHRDNVYEVGGYWDYGGFFF